MLNLCLYMYRIWAQVHAFRSPSFSRNKQSHQWNENEILVKFWIIGEGDLDELEDDPDAVEPDVIDRILERELQRNYSLEGSPDRLTPKASPIRRRSPIRSPERGRRTLFSPSKLPQNRSLFKKMFFRKMIFYHNCRILIMSYLVKY